MTSLADIRANASALAAVEPVGARDRILTSATRLFQSTGYEGTSVNRIASAAGMTAANLYWHFPSKQDLLAEVLGNLYQRSYDVLVESVGTDGDAVERMTRYVSTYVWIQVTELGENCNFGYMTLMSSLTPEDQTALQTRGRPFLELLRGIVRQGQGEGVFHVDDVKVTAFAISSMVEYVFQWFRQDGPLSLEQVSEQYVRLALRMAGASAALVPGEHH